MAAQGSAAPDLAACVAVHGQSGADVDQPDHRLPTDHDGRLSGQARIGHLGRHLLRSGADPAAADPARYQPVSSLQRHKVRIASYDKSSD